MASRYWIKLHHALLDDPQMGRLSDSQFRLAINLLLLAGDYEQGGRLPALEDMRWRLRDPAHFDEDLAALAACGILSEADGSLQVAHFAERQAAMSAEERSRMRQERARREDYQAQADRTKSARCVQEPARCAHECGTDEDIDVDADEEADEDRDEDADAQTARGSGSNPEDALVNCFITETGIPLNAGGEQKWAAALQRLRSSGVSVADMQTALRECRAKKLVIASLASIVTPAIIARSRRIGSRASPQDDAADYRRYLNGKYGDFGLS